MPASTWLADGGGGATTGASTATSLGLTIAAQPFIVVGVAIYRAAGAPTSIVVTDDLGSVYTRYGPYQLSASGKIILGIFAASQAQATTTITAAPGDGVASLISMGSEFFEGQSLGGPIFDSWSGASGTGTAVNSGTISVDDQLHTLGAYESMFFGIMADEGADAGSITNNSSGGHDIYINSAGALRFASMYFQNNANSTIAWTESGSENWAALGVSMFGDGMGRLAYDPAVMALGGPRKT